jgi:hypothetical protein
LSKLHLFVIAAIAAPLPLRAQSIAPPPPALIASLPANRAILRAGTEVPLILSEEITTKGKKLHVGQRVRMETAEAVFVQGINVIPVGSPAVGEITDVENKGMWGKSGHVGIRALYTTVNGRQIRLSGSVDDKGVAGGVGAVAVSAIVFLPAGFFMTGTSAKLPLGTAIKGFLDEDVPLEIAPAALAPMVIAAPAQPLAVAVTPVGSAAPATAVAAVGPTMLVSKTPSGFCYDVPRGYAGLGTAEKPALTSATPACWEVTK